MLYNVRIEDTTGFDVIGDECFDNYEDVLHFMKAILPYVDYYEYSAIVDEIYEETGEILSTEEYAWCVTNCGGFLVCETLYLALSL